jgi:hypothetical protein
MDGVSSDSGVKEDPMVKMIRPVVVALLALTLVPGCGGAAPGLGNGGSGGDPAVDLEPGELEALDVDDCALLTAAEVTQFAGDELVISEDTPLGCAYVEPGETMAQFTVQSYRGGGDATAAAKALIANPKEITELDGVGDDAVAVSTHGEVINWVIAREGDLFVVINQTFLLIEPGPAELDRSGELAATALGRLVDAA